MPSAMLRTSNMLFNVLLRFGMASVRWFIGSARINQCGQINQNKICSPGSELWIKKAISRTMRTHYNICSGPCTTVYSDDTELQMSSFIPIVRILRSQGQLFERIIVPIQSSTLIVSAFHFWISFCDLVDTVRQSFENEKSSETNRICFHSKLVEIRPCLFSIKTQRWTTILTPWRTRSHTMWARICWTRWVNSVLR